MKRVGHKGADLLAPGNTFASFAAALAAGVDMIEFDVLSEHPDGSGELRLAHDFHDAASRTPHTLDEGLALFAGEPYDGVELDVDLKLPGYEARVVDALRRHGLLDRALISTMELASLRRIRALEPRLRLGLSVPRLRHDPLARPHTALLAHAGAAALRRVLPRRGAGLVAAGTIDAMMCHWRLVTPALVSAMHGAGGEVYVWTVDERETIEALHAMGVAGVISNDPRLFG